MFDKILVANDGSPDGSKALDAGLELALRLGLGLTMVCAENIARYPTVVEIVPPAQSEIRSPFDSVVDEARARATARGVAFEAEILAGHPVPRIVDYIEKGGYDLLIVGFMGHSALYKTLIGSNADRLVALAPCTVMVVK